MSVSKITLEITTRCNLACVMCPHGLPGGYPGAADAEDHLVDQVMDMIGDVDEIQPTGVGEPLLAPGFWRIADALAGKPSPKLTFYTNGILLSDTNVARLADVPMDFVNVSFDAARPETFSRIRGGDMERTIAGTRRIIALRDQRSGNQKFYVKMCYVLMRENLEEFQDFVRLARDLDADFVYTLHLIDPQMDPNHWAVKRGDFNFNYRENWLKFDPDYSDRILEPAIDLADELGVNLYNSDLFFDKKKNERLLLRPCTRRMRELISSNDRYVL